MNRHSTTGSDGSTRHLTEDEVLDLLQDYLPREERERLLSHAADCEACEQMLRERVIEHERLRATRPLPATATPWWRCLRAALTAPAYPYGAAAIAAAAVLVILLWPRGGPPGSEQLTWLPVTEENIRFRWAPQEGIDSILVAGLEAYETQDLERATRLLKDASAEGEMELIRKMYLGSALAWQGRYAEAVRILSEVSDPALPDPWGSEARWTLYVALRASGHESRADSLLRRLAEESGEVALRAREQLK